MADFKSEEVLLHSPAETVYGKVANLDNLKALLAKVPEGQLSDKDRATLEAIQVDGDTITIPGGPTGALSLRVCGRKEPEYVELEGVGTPVPLKLRLAIRPDGADSCFARVEMDLQVPMMMKPLIAGPMKKMTEQAAQMLKGLA